MMNISKKKLSKAINTSKYINIFLIFLVFLTCAYRLYFGKNYGISFLLAPMDTYDTGFFLNNVLNFVDYNVNTPFALIKNRAYMWFLLFVNYSKLDLRICVSILWIIAAFFILFVIKKITNNKYFSVIGFIYVSLHPIAYNATTAYRNIIFVPIILIILSLYVLFHDYLSKSKYIQSVLIAIFLGLVFVFLYFLTETGIVFMAIHLGLLLLFFIFFIIDCIKTDGFGSFFVHEIIKKTIIIFLPIIIGFVGIICYKFVNYRVFGVYEINMRTEGEVARFISNVQNIDSEKTNTLIWCSEEQIDKAYAMSKTFQQNEMIYNDLKNEVLGTEPEDSNYYGDFLGWGISNSLNNNKISYKDTTLIFKNINEELESAFASGELKKTKKIKLTKTLGRFSKKEIVNEIFPLFKKMILEMTFLKNIDLSMEWLFVIPPADNTGEYIDFFNIKINKPNKKLQAHYYNFVDLYKVVNAVMFIFLILNIMISLSIVLIKYISKNKKVKNNNKLKINYKYFILTIVFSGFYILYLFSISLFVIWIYRFNPYVEFEQTIYHYCSMSLGFFIFAFVFSFATYYKSLIDNKKIIFQFIKSRQKRVLKK